MSHSTKCPNRSFIRLVSHFLYLFFPLIHGETFAINTASRWGNTSHLTGETTFWWRWNYFPFFPLQVNMAPQRRWMTTHVKSCRRRKKIAFLAGCWFAIHCFFMTSSLKETGHVQTVEGFINDPHRALRWYRVEFFFRLPNYWTRSLISYRDPNSRNMKRESEGEKDLANDVVARA